MNKHITENISYYLSLEQPEYAILISGKWGSGKTYFIDDFINNNIDPNSSDERNKFIKISLFGLKEVSGIDEQIFQNLHPVLASKYARFTGNLLKSAFKFGIKIDFDGDEKKDGSLSTRLDKFNPLEFLTDKSKKDKKIVFIFDDLERTEINIKEVLGYINYLVEQASFKVILVANEEKLIKKDSKTYLEFKEKVIGKTVEIRHDFPEVLKQFLEDNPIKIDAFDQTIVENVYDLAGYKNLRHIKQSIIDFNYLTSKIEKKYKNSEVFLSKLTFTFFAFNIEVKNGSLDEKDFLTRNIFPGDSDKSEKSPVIKVLKKYKLDSNLLFSLSYWIKILYKSYIEDDELNTAISKLAFFIKDKEKPSWVKLWHYRDLEDDEFDNLLKDVTDKFKNCEYESPELFLHAIALLVYFNQENISDFSLKNIKEKVNNCLSSSYENSEIWKNELLRSYARLNSTGFSYMNNISSDFLEIFQVVKSANKEIYDKNLDENKFWYLNGFIESIKSGDMEFINNILLVVNEYSPVFNSLSPERFFNSITEASNKNFVELSQILHSRYSDNKSLDGRGYEYHLVDELSFWQGLKINIESFDYSKHKIKGLNLKEFQEHIVDKILGKMADKS